MEEPANFGTPNLSWQTQRNSVRPNDQHRLFALSAILVALSIASCSRNESSNDYPDRPIEIIVPFAPGGGSDTFARLLKAEVEEQELLPHPLVIINAPGAGGSVGSRRVMNEAPDGYTVLLLHDAILTAKRSGKTLYGPEVFEQVAGTGQTGTVVAVHENSPHNNLSDLLTAAANEPDTVTFAANLGAPSHFVGLMLEQAHGSAKFRFAQTGGGADRFAALKGEHAAATAFSLEEYLRFRSDGVKALAFLGGERHEQLPDVASAEEQGFPMRHSVVQYWWMPKGTPVERRELFAQVLKKAMASERFQQKLIDMKIDPIYLDGEDLATHLEKTEAAISLVDPGAESPLPNVSIVLAGLTLLLGAGMVATRYRTNSRTETDTPEEITAAKNSPWWLAAICSGLLIAYTLTTIYWELPLGVATTIFVGLLGFVLAWRDDVTNRWLVFSAIAGAAVGLGVTFHIVFTQLFEIGL